MSGVGGEAGHSFIKTLFCGEPIQFLNQPAPRGPAALFGPSSIVFIIALFKFPLRSYIQSEVGQCGRTLNDILRGVVAPHWGPFNLK